MDPLSTVGVCWADCIYGGGEGPADAAVARSQPSASLGRRSPVGSMVSVRVGAREESWASGVAWTMMGDTPMDCISTHAVSLGVHPAVQVDVSSNNFLGHKKA
jgi:hypothetical protein